MKRIIKILLGAICEIAIIVLAIYLFGLGWGINMDSINASMLSMIPGISILFIAIIAIEIMRN